MATSNAGSQLQANDRETARADKAFARSERAAAGVTTALLNAQQADIALRKTKVFEAQNARAQLASEEKRAATILAGQRKIAEEARNQRVAAAALVKANEAAMAEAAAKEKGEALDKIIIETTSSATAKSAPQKTTGSLTDQGKNDKPINGALADGMSMLEDAKAQRAAQESKHGGNAQTEKFVRDTMIPTDIQEQRAQSIADSIIHGTQPPERGQSVGDPASQAANQSVGFPAASTQEFPGMNMLPEFDTQGFQKGESLPVHIPDQSVMLGQGATMAAQRAQANGTRNIVQQSTNARFTPPVAPPVAQPAAPQITEPVVEPTRSMIASTASTKERRENSGPKFPLLFSDDTRRTMAEDVINDIKENRLIANEQPLQSNAQSLFETERLRRLDDGRIREDAMAAARADPKTAKLLDKVGDQFAEGLLAQLSGRERLVRLDEQEKLFLRNKNDRTADRAERTLRSNILRAGVSMNLQALGMDVATAKFLSTEQRRTMLERAKEAGRAARGSKKTGKPYRRSEAMKVWVPAFNEDDKTWMNKRSALMKEHRAWTSKLKQAQQIDGTGKKAKLNELQKNNVRIAKEHLAEIEKDQEGFDNERSKIRTDAGVDQPYIIAHVVNLEKADWDAGRPLKSPEVYLAEVYAKLKKEGRNTTHSVEPEGEQSVDPAATFTLDEGRDFWSAMWKTNKETAKKISYQNALTTMINHFTQPEDPAKFVNFAAMTLKDLFAAVDESGLNEEFDTLMADAAGRGE